MVMSEDEDLAMKMQCNESSATSDFQKNAPRLIKFVQLSGDRRAELSGDGPLLPSR